MIRQVQETDTGRSDRASSADGIEGSARMGANNSDAFDTSEDCLSESECRVAVSGGTEHPEAVSGQTEREPHIREKGLS